MAKVVAAKSVFISDGKGGAVLKLPGQTFDVSDPKEIERLRQTGHAFDAKTRQAREIAFAASEASKAAKEAEESGASAEGENNEEGLI